MNESFPRSIFRVDAVRRYARGREAAVLPRFVSPPTGICLLVQLGLLIAGGFVAWQCCREVRAPSASVLRIEVRQR
jgi:hypothetical protein